MKRYCKQKTDFSCGPACLRMILGPKEYSEESLVKILGTNNKEGTSIANFEKGLKELGLDYKIIRNSNLEELKKYSRKQYDIIVRYEPPKVSWEHYALFDRIKDGRIHFYDPYFGKDHSYLLKTFESHWKSDVENVSKLFIAISTSNE